MESLKTPCAYFVTTRVPSIYPRIRFNIQSLNISKFDTISLETWWRRKLCGWSLSTSTIKRQIFFTKPLDGLRFESLCKTTGFGVIPWLISLVWLIISSLQYRSHMCMFVSFTKFAFVLVFVDLTLHVLFLSVLKNSKIHKNWKISKNLIACVVYITCEFGLVPPY